MNNKLEQLKKITESRNSSSTNENISSLLALMMSKFSSDMEKIKGEQGESGYTPIKGVDYFTEEEIDSMVEYMQSKVKDGKDGEQGLPGKNGKNGLTPIRGVDYWTSSDKESIISDIIRVIPIPKDGISPSVDEIKQKVLSDLDSRPINEKIVTKDELVNFLKRGGFRGGGISNITGLVEAGTNVTITGTGTNGDPYVINSSGGGGGTPGGSDKYVQFNDGGAFGGESTFTFDKTLVQMSVGGIDTMTVNGSLIGSKIATHAGDGLTQVDIEMHKHSATAGAGASIYGARSRGGVGTETIVQNGDAVLNITGVGFDGTDYATLAQIQFEVDGTPGSNDMPGRMVFNTSSDGGQTLTERLRIGANGDLTVAGLAGSGSRVVVADATGILSATNALISGSGVNTQITYWTGASTIAGSTAFTWNDTSKRFTITDGVFPGPGRAFLVDGPNYTVDMGDISSKSGRTGMTINPVAETITMYGQDATAAKVRIFEAFTNTDILGAGLSIVMGDIDNSANGTQMQLIDQSGLFRVAGANYRALNLDFASESYGFADYTQTTSGGSNVGGIEIAAGGVFNMWGIDATSTISPFLSLTGPGDITLGDLNGVGSATTFSILESSGGIYDFTSRSFQIGGHTYLFPNTQAISGQALVAQDTSGTLLYENVQRNHFAQTQSVTVANTTTPTTITGTGEGSLLVRSGTAKVGSTYELDFEGFYTSTSSANIGYKLKILGTNIGSSITNTLPDNSAGWDVRAHFKLTVLTTGASGTASLNGYITYDKNDGTSVTYPLNQTAFQAIDTTINQTTDFVATWSAANALNSITIRQLTFNQTR